MKPFIARDTDEPLVVLGGYPVAADGSIIRQPIGQSQRPTATSADKELLASHGITGLRQQGLFGVLDRLQASGIDLRADDE